MEKEQTIIHMLNNENRNIFFSFVLLNVRLKSYILYCITVALFPLPLPAPLYCTLNTGASQVRHNNIVKIHLNSKRRTLCSP